MKRAYFIAAVCAALSAALSAAPTANEDFVIAEAAAAYTNAVAAATNYTDAAIAAAEPDFSTGNTQLVATIEATAPAPGDYAAVSNAAMSALQEEADPAFSAWADAHVVAGGSMVDWSIDSMYAQYLGDAFAQPKYTAQDITDALSSMETAIAGKYPNASGNQLAQQVSAIGAHLNGEDARFVVTNYDSVVHTPEAYVEIKVSNNWLRVWDEGTRWNQYETWKTNVDAELSYKADRAWGIYDSETGGYSPAGFTQVSSSNILIAAGMAYQRTVTSDGAVWVLQCNQGVAQVSGDTNGFFRVMDSDGVTQFEIIKGTRREMGCDASRISLDHSTTPNNVIIPYSVVSEEHPTLYITQRLETPNWKAETDSDCIATVTWTGSSGAYVATVHPKAAYASMFVRATYMVGGETYIRNAAPVEMPSLYLNGTKYYLGTATISGHTVLTLSTTAP